MKKAELVGSVKQVAWAESIRNFFINEYTLEYRIYNGKESKDLTLYGEYLRTLKYIEQDEANGNQPSHYDIRRKERFEMALKGAQEMVETKTSAGWWIDNRDRLGRIARGDVW